MADYCVPDKVKAALLTVSAQRDFARPGSPLRACGVGRALPAMRRLVEGFRGCGAPVFHSVRLYRPDGSNVDACRREAVEEGLRILMPGSFGSELLEELKPDPAVRLDPDCLLSGRFQKLGAAEWAFYRPRWGAFHDTGLEPCLRELDVTTLVICGFSFTTGTRATVYEASARDFRVVLVPDAVCGSTEEAVMELARMGIYLMSSDNCLGWLAGPGRPPAAV
ncbi:MAG: cysteine hydrolase family protein [Kiloniellaceae bacterium]